MDCSLLGSSFQGILQARILEWAAIFFFSRGSSQSRDQTHISSTGRRVLYQWATKDAKDSRQCWQKGSRVYGLAGTTRMLLVRGMVPKAAKENLRTDFFCCSFFSFAGN